jgi:leucine-rich repeat-containing protein 49
LSISAEWKLEISRIKSKGLNSSRRKNKETINDCLVQSGHAEIEGNTSLFIYGNALEVISKPEFQDSINNIHFQYIHYDHIVQNSALVRLKKFANLKKLSFSDSNLHSWIHLSKLEIVTGLQSFNIENNDIVHTELFRCFIVYRFPGITEINTRNVDDEDKDKAKQQFQNFDKILCMPSFFVNFI